MPEHRRVRSFMERVTDTSLADLAFVVCGAAVAGVVGYWGWYAAVYFFGSTP